MRVREGKAMRSRGSVAEREDNKGHIIGKETRKVNQREIERKNERGTKH